MSMTLVLNASFEPLGVVGERRAVVLVLSEKAVVLEERGESLHSEFLVVTVPSVVRLRYYVRVPHQASVPLSRQAVFERDGFACAYCGRRSDTIDHVVPRSRGGLHAWTNVVAACQRCNHRKADRLLAELGWTLPSPPVMPRHPLLRLRGAGHVRRSWSRYLDPDGWVEDAAS